MINLLRRLSWKKKFIGIFIILLIIWIFAPKLFKGKEQQSEKYQTEKAERSTLVVSITASGQVAAVNSASVTTEASGVVTNVYIKDGDIVQTGDKIADIELDLEGKQRASQTLANYQNAKNTLDATQVKMYTLQADMFDKWDTFKELAENDTYKDVNSANRNLPEFHIPQKEWFAAEATYKNQQAVISQAQTAVSSAWITYQQSSPVIYAPISGSITGFSLQKGTVITTQRASTSNTATTQKVASVKTDAPPTISINLTEIDVPQVKVGQKATVTFDALANKKFEGQVVSVDTIGSVNSGVTTYPTVISLDAGSPDILPNMAASANIVIQSKENVLLVPSAAIQSQNGQTTIRIQRQGKIEQVPVQVGLSSDTQTEIVSGIHEGDDVIAGSTMSPASTRQTSQSQSPFGGGFGGGGAFRPGGFGGGGRR